MIHIYVEKEDLDKVVDGLSNGEEIVIKKTDRKNNPIIVTINQNTADKLSLDKENFRNDFRGDY